MITSILDSDLYKFSMQQAVLELYPDAEVTYKFINRGTQRFGYKFLEALKNEIAKMATLSLSDEEYKWVKTACPYFKPAYLEYLKNYKFNPSEVEAHIRKNGDLSIVISGKWHSTILWEVPLLALVSEVYFSTIKTEWKTDRQKERAAQKGKALFDADVKFADFGTRRRRSFDIQDSVVEQLVKSGKGSCLGTSNMFLAMKYNVRPIGTQAHEFIQAVSALESLNHANRFAMERWLEVYPDDLGIVLTDTYGSEAFFSEFNSVLAKRYEGVRQDSGDPIEFGNSAIWHYEKLGIDPMTKTIIFSDSLNVEKAISINKYFAGKIKIAFGVGTHFSNDFDNSPALNIVIKLYSVNDFPVVKLSDVEGKETGDSGAIKAVKWIYKRN